MSFKPSNCTYCGEKIAWTKSRKGKNVPVDVESLSEEDVEILGRKDEALGYRYKGHVCHFETCTGRD